MTLERIRLLKIGKKIRSDKKKMLLEILYIREAVLIFEWSKIEQVLEKIALLVKIHIILYKL